ncbi:hypothetical protein ERJ75_001830400 [Trypanosoma vivax]|nr:hypothetical protein ERJ75_001830400 [Trypanosoma vivax]
MREVGTGVLPETGGGEASAKLLAALRHLTGNRALFMEVLELAARLEVEEVFEMLCVEFGCIYQKEVGSDFASRLLSSWSQRGAELREVDAYREKVARAFATETRHLSPSLSHTSLFSSQVDRHGDVDRIVVSCKTGERV